MHPNLGSASGSSCTTSGSNSGSGLTLDSTLGGNFGFDFGFGFVFDFRVGCGVSKRMFGNENGGRLTSGSRSRIDFEFDVGFHNGVVMLCADFVHLESSSPTSANFVSV